MPITEWWLKKWSPAGNDLNYVTVQIDPALVGGGRATFGPMLFLPYTLPKPEDASKSLQLLSLEGWIGCGNESESHARLVIPSQVIWPGGQPKLQVPLTDAQIEAIEKTRNGGPVNLMVWLGGLAYAGQTVVPVHSASAGSLAIKREDWLTIFQQLGAGARRLVELPDPRLPREVPGWAECVRLLDGATQLHRNGEYEHALANCRQIVEGIPQVLGTVWGLQLPRNGQPPFAVWIQGLEAQLRDAWPEDRLTPGMLQTMIAGAWRWLAPTPHYGTGIPQREDVAFALGLCTDLLQFAGQVLQAHPNPIASTP